jgi:hypothetical protein
LGIDAVRSSLAAIIVQFGYTLFAMHALEVLGAAAAIPFPLVIILIGVTLVWFARRSRKVKWMGKSRASKARRVVARVSDLRTQNQEPHEKYRYVGQKVGLPHLDQPVDIFMELNRPNASPLPREFLGSFRRRWFERLAKHRGAGHFQEYPVDEQVLYTLENKNDS